MSLNHTHDPAARSWLDSDRPGGDFPIQNLPYGVFRRAGSSEPWRGGVAIDDQILDLAALARTCILETLPGQMAELAQHAAEAASAPALNDFMAMGPAAWHALRHMLFELLRIDGSTIRREIVRSCLVPQAAAEHAVPVRVGDYTDFYTSLHHARNCGEAIGKGSLVTPNFLWMPIAYHGRASTLGVNRNFHRPLGQYRTAESEPPKVGACQRLDYELEIAIYVGQSNGQGRPVSLDQAEDHIFGIGLLNDWSARDIQFWEMAPLGPFLGKNFATGLSPWIVTLEALAPFRLPFERDAEYPEPLPYLDGAALRESGALNVELSVGLQTARMRSQGQPDVQLSRTNFRHQHWCMSQMLTHHTMGGCRLQAGDILGTGTISGPTLPEAGAMLELSMAGRNPVQLPNGETRGFLEDGDTVVLRGWCERQGAVRIGLGECRGEVLAAIE